MPNKHHVRDKNKNLTKHAHLHKTVTSKQAKLADKHEQIIHQVDI